MSLNYIFTHHVAEDEEKKKSSKQSGGGWCFEARRARGVENRLSLAKSTCDTLRRRFLKAKRRLSRNRLAGVGTSGHGAAHVFEDNAPAYTYAFGRRAASTRHCCMPTN